MAAIKSYTDLSQSRKLAEILPLKSADMCFNISQRSNMPPLMTPYSKFKEFFDMDKTPDFLIPCWSLAALLDVLKDGALDFANSRFRVYSNGVTKYMDNPVDACYEMIIKLNEQNIL